MARAKILISTQNPIIGGGVGSMRKALGAFLDRQGFSVAYTFPTRKLNDIFKAKSLEKLKVDGLSAYQARSIPYIHPLEQFTAYFSMRKLLKKFDIRQSLGGSVFPALPFAIASRSFVCWVATTIKDEDRLIFKHFDITASFRRSLLYGIYYILSPIFYLVESYIYSKADRIIALSHHTAAQIQKQFQIPKEKMVVIPYPVDTACFKPGFNLDDSVDNDFILMVGRVNDPRKNIKLLLESFSIIKKKHPQIDLLIIGDNGPDSRLDELCHRLGIKTSLRFLGTMPNHETIKYFARAKLSILPSYQEGLGIVVLESMACGTPVVSTRCGGPEEIIIDGENGYLVENNDPVAMAKAVCEILGNDALRKKMSINARECIRLNYSSETVGEKFIQIYKEVFPESF